MTPTENDSGLKDSAYPRCQKCSGRFVPTSFEQAYCLECSHELLGEDMIKAQPEQPPAREAKYSFRREHGKLYVVQPNGYFLCECCHESDAQQIIDALNGQAELAQAKEAAEQRYANLLLQFNNTTMREILESQLANEQRKSKDLETKLRDAEQRARELEAKIADLPMRWREVAETIAPTAAAVQCRWHAQEIERILAKHQSDRAVEEPKSPSRQDS